MKKNLLLSILLIAFFSNYAQKPDSYVPQAIKYQAVARDHHGDVFQETRIQVQIAIILDDIHEKPVYVEEHRVTTDEFGVLSLEIGKGNVEVGDFSEISWLRAENVYVNVIMDTPDGLIEGITELLSVPYSLAADKAYWAHEADYAQEADYATLSENTEHCPVWTENSTYVYNNSKSVGIGTSTEETSSALEVKSTTKGFLPSRMTTAQRDAISNPAAGLQVYNTETNCLNYFTGDVWFEVCGDTASLGPCNGITSFEYDGQIYNTVEIGDQCWMKENLATTHYSDGTALVDGTGAGHTEYDLTTKYYFAYDDDESNVATYGRLYTWAAIMNDEISSNANPSGVQGICPNGWHVPSGNEWTELTDYLGGESVAGRKMKSTGTIEGGDGLWYEPNTGATNESGFSALPGGNREPSHGYSYSKGNVAFFWSSREVNSHGAWCRLLHYENGRVSDAEIHKTFGFSVRCVKD
ncbi:MAG: hypothetical protein KAT68_02685 [Bacteroidales bacterium]|nr:hypothetical protein [Bacteroidales bacterium]